MPASGHTTGYYNIIATLQAWLGAELPTRVPPLLSTVVVIVDWPETPLDPPCYTTTFLGAYPDAQPYQGNRTGAAETGRRMYGLLEVNCWVSRAAGDWAAKVAQMADAVTECVAEARAVGGSIPVKDFYTSATAPANAGYRIFLEGVELRMPPTDPNPDYERRRMLISFHWVERVSN